MSAGDGDGTADRQADASAEEEGQSQAASSLPAVDLPRERGGDAEERSDAHVQQSLDFEMDEDLSRSAGEDQQVKMKCFREPHRQIEKRRRDKMNNLIDELSAVIPSCKPLTRKPDKLTVLRRTVQHLKALKVGTSSSFTDTTYKPSFLPEEDKKQLLLRAADGFLLVVSCDRGKILFISESVSKILNFCRLELTGQSVFDFVHPKDISKVKEQLSSSELYPHERLIDAATGVQVHADVPVRASHLCTGARRSFFCRMKHSRVAGKPEDKCSLPSSSKKKDSYRYCTVHCTGYTRSWPSSQLDVSESDSEKESSHLTCLVMACRVHAHVSHQPPKDVNVKPTEFVTRCAIDGKFTFVDQQATTITGYLPQEVLGTSCYEYFHQDDLQQLAEKHRGPSLTKDNKEPGSSKALQEDTKRMLPIIPGLSSGAGTMIYAGSIGTQIANELIDSYRLNSPSSGAASPFGPAQDKTPLPQTSRTVSIREEAAGSSGTQTASGTAALASNATQHAGEASQLDLDNMAVPSLSSFSSNEAAMAVIMSLLDTDVNMSQAVDFEDIRWPL